MVSYPSKKLFTEYLEFAKTDNNSATQIRQLVIDIANDPDEVDLLVAMGKALLHFHPENKV